ncbi:alkaline phosphatase 4 [Drosophila willistoni]|uniref:alkaline phosphatase 4 n=1 Tax=Drosophila willistoni TaxID=7260 RepID=UPI000C26C226|nr:alkaline phosphatase 4 [Drosophila willistoni]
MRYEVENEVANVADVNYWKDRVSVEQKLWYDKGIEEVNMALKEPSTENTVKNVRIFVIEGIGYEELAANRFPLNINNSKENTNFVWDQFSHVARLKMNCIIPCPKNWIHQALWTGVPLDVLQMMNTNCSSQAKDGHLLSLLRQAQLAGLRTGFVTNQRLTGPTGAALYGKHASNLSNECEKQSSNETLCNDDIATQLIFGETGKHLNVIMGGGRQMFNHEVPVTNSDPIDDNLCRASYERNLLKNWRLQKLRQVEDQTRQRFELIQHFGELEAINGSKYDYLMAVLSNGDLNRNLKVSSFQLMLKKTLQVLNRSNAGYLLIVEQFVHAEMNKREQLQMLNETLTDLPRDKHTLNLVLFTSIERTLNGFLPSDSLVFVQGPKSSIFLGVRDVNYLAQAVTYALKN